MSCGIALGAALCVSLRGAMVLTAIAALILLVVRSVSLLCRFGLSLPPLAGGLLGVGVGGGLWLLLRGFFPAFAAEIAAPVWLFALCFVCGMGAALPLSIGGLTRIAAAWWVIGGLREVLSAGTLFAWPLAAEGISASFGWGMGGFLVAAGVLWAFRLGSPVKVIPSPPYKAAAMSAAGVTAVVCAVQPLLTTLPDWWRFWWSAMVTVVLLTVVLARFPFAAAFWESGIAAVVPLLAVSIPSSLTWAAVAVAGAGVAAAAMYAVNGRMRRIPAAMGGAPAALMIAAFAMAAVSPL